MNPKLFRIKICGVTDAAGIEAVGAAGADAIGLNFFPPSPRHVDLDTARRILQQAPSALQKVGVFVNAPLPHVQSVVQKLELDWVQLHGDEPPSFLHSLPNTPVLKAFRIRDMSFEPVVRYLDECNQLQCSPQAVLLDAYAPRLFGGTGHSLDWDPLSDMIVKLGAIPWVLAGGLNPTNVADAIRASCPHAVDTASGVESAPGKKDPQQVLQFVRSARSALEGIGR